MRINDMIKTINIVSSLHQFDSNGEGPPAINVRMCMCVWVSE